MRKQLNLSEMQIFAAMFVLVFGMTNIIVYANTEWYNIALGILLILIPSAYMTSYYMHHNQQIPKFILWGLIISIMVYVIHAVMNILTIAGWILQNSENLLMESTRVGLLVIVTGVCIALLSANFDNTRLIKMTEKATGILLFIVVSMLIQDIITVLYLNATGTNFMPDTNVSSADVALSFMGLQYIAFFKAPAQNSKKASVLLVITLSAIAIFAYFMGHAYIHVENTYKLPLSGFFVFTSLNFSMTTYYIIALAESFQVMLAIFLLIVLLKQAVKETLNLTNHAIVYRFSLVSFLMCAVLIAMSASTEDMVAKTTYLATIAQIALIGGISAHVIFLTIKSYHKGYERGLLLLSATVPITYLIKVLILK